MSNTRGRRRVTDAPKPDPAELPDGFVPPFVADEPAPAPSAPAFTSAPATVVSSTELRPGGGCRHTVRRVRYVKGKAHRFCDDCGAEVPL